MDNETLNLSYINSDSLDSEVNQSLHYNFSSNEYFVDSKSPGKIFVIENISIINSTINSSNNSSNTYNNSNQTIDINCDFEFSIVPHSNITSEKIEFNFGTDILENYTINYWVENYLDDIVKNSRNTTNLNKKVYTPKDYTELYYIKAKIFYDKCVLNDSKLVVYYSISRRETQKSSYTKKTSSASKLEDNSGKLKDSYIKILNKDEIMNDSLNEEVEYEIYTGDTLKRTIYFYVNHKKVSSIELKKYTKTKGRIDLSNYGNLLSFSIEGLDVFDSINFSVKKDMEDKKVLAKYFMIGNLTLKNTALSFDITTNRNNSLVLCYINYKRTLVSEILNLSFSNISVSYTLDINESILKQKMN